MRYIIYFLKDVAYMILEAAEFKGTYLKIYSL